MRIPGSAPVVVGVNGTAAGLAAARLGAREAIARGQTLRIVHVFTWPGHRSFDDAPDWAAARHEAADIVAQAVGTAERTVPGVRVEGLLLDGQPVRELLKQTLSAGMIALGDDDLTSSMRLPAESVLVQIVARARCPVVVARAIRPPAGPIVTAVDGSPSSLLALQLAAGEAQRRDIPLEIAHVVEQPDGRQTGRRLLETVAGMVPGVPGVRLSLLVGEPAPTLVRASHRARMMILGPRGTGGSSLLGSVAQHLLHHCVCPTVFVHGTPAGDQSSAGTVPSAGALIS